MKKRAWCRVLTVLLLAAYLFRMAAFPAEAAQIQKEDGRVRVGFFAFDGYHMIDSQGKRSGYGYDYLQYLARYADFEYEYVGYDKNWDEMQDMLEEGEIDLLTSAQRTRERLERFDFSDRPIGSSAAILTVKAGDNRYMVEDYAQLDGIRIGLLQGNSRNRNLEQFAEQNSFTYEPVYFEDGVALEQALQENDGIDAILTSNLRKIQKEWIIATFDVTPFYVMVQKGNQPLLDEINRAIDRLEADHKDLTPLLFEKYYSSDNGDEIAYTAEERRYIQERRESGRTIRVTINLGRAPISDFGGGTARGIVPEIAREVLRRTGLPYTFIGVPPAANATEDIVSGKSDVRFDGIADFNAAENCGLRVTDPYLALPISGVTLRSFEGTPASAAVICNSDVVDKYVEKIYDEGDITRYDSAAECLNAVLDGRQDTAFFQTYVAQRLVNSDVRNRLKEQLIPGYEMKFAISTRKEERLLFSILDKAARSMKQEEINRIVQQQTVSFSPEMSLVGYLYKHPGFFLLLLTAAAGFLITLILYATRQKKLGLEREKTREFERFISYVCKVNNRVIEVEPAGRRYLSYQMKDKRVCCEEKCFDEGEPQIYDLCPQDSEHVNSLTEKKKLERLMEDGGEIHFECRVRQTAQEEDYRWSAFTFQGMPQDEKNKGSLMIFIKDIDETRREEEKERKALRDALEAARQASAARGTFLSRMSHEIRTPLNAILGYLTIAGANPQDRDKVEECRQKSEFAAHQLLNIVNDVLDISAIESGKMKIAYEEFNLRQLLSGITSIFRTQAEAKGVGFHVRLNGLTAETLIGDPLRLNQILMNLLSNAVKFTASGGQVVLTIRQKAQAGQSTYLQFEVADTGIGMSEDYKTRMFQPFEQQDASIASQFGGTGLGLSITQNLVSMMNGTIDVQSKEGRGTLFTVNLSFDAAQAGQNTAVNEAARADYELAGMRILLAEDNELNMDIAKEILTGYGITVDGASNGKEAVECFERSAEGWYQAVLMDIQMPVMNGYEAAEKIRSGSHPQAGAIPIIALTADAFTEDINHALAVGMNDHVSKPIDFMLLCRIIAENTARD